jgi:hypothetical protein
MVRGEANGPTSDEWDVSRRDVQPAPTIELRAKTLPPNANDDRESAAGHLDLSGAHRFGDYDLLGEIARGGMGVVYKALDRKLNRIVALKMVLSGRFASEQDLRRFHIEAEAAAKLDHSGIVPIYEVGQCEGQHYFTMKFVPGGSLAERLADLRSDPRGAVALLAKVARAVSHAHQRGILHRDLKPANILIDESGEPLVSDLGLAKSVSADSQLTQSGAIVGTPSYMSPEQATGASDVTTAADVYALGAILYEALSGRPPHQASTALDTLMKVVNETPASLRSLDSTIDQGLERIALKCLERSPAARYSSAAALAEDLERWLAGEPLSVRPASAASAAQLWLRRNLRSAAGAAIVGLMAGLAYGATFWLSAIAPRFATAKIVYNAFPSEPRPWGAFGYHLPDWVQNLTLFWLIILLMLVGLVNVAVVRPVRRAGWIASGVICGMSVALSSYAVSFGWGPIAFQSVFPTYNDIRLLSRSMFVDSPEDAQRLRRSILRRHPDLASAVPDARADFLSAKIQLDQVSSVPVGLWYGIAATLLGAMVPTICGTVLAGSMLEREGKLSRVVGPYLEVMGSATSFCVIGVVYWVGALASSQIASPPIVLQAPFFLGLALACIAALRRWKWTVRLLVSSIWVVALALTVAFFVYLSRTGNAVTDLVARGELKRAAERLEINIGYDRRDAYAQLAAGVLRLKLGQFDRYQTRCQAMLAQFSGGDSADNADKTAKLCLLAPGAITDIAPALDLAEVAVDEGYHSPYEAWFFLVRGLAEYRAAHHDSALAWLSKCQAPPHPVRGPTAKLLESMALARLERPAEAQTAFREATGAFDGYLASADESDIRATWLDRMIFDVLREEALKIGLAP